MSLFAEKVEEIRPKLVVLDPLYLAAKGADGSNIYSMGEMLERPQLICAAVSVSLFVVHHFNRGNRTGLNRISGAGFAEWARVSIGADVKSRHTDPATAGTTVVTELDVMGGEIPELSWRVKRQMVADDPDDLDSPLHYSVEVFDSIDDSGTGGDMPPARRKLLEALEAVGQNGATGSELVDWVHDKYGHGLYRTTVSTQLNEARKEGLVDCVEEPGKATVWFPPSGVSPPVATTGRRHQTTGDPGGVLSLSSRLEDDNTPTPQNDTFDLSPEEIAGI